MFLSIKDIALKFRSLLNLTCSFTVQSLIFFSVEAELREIKKANHQIRAQNEIQILFAMEFQTYHPHRIASDLN